VSDAAADQVIAHAEVVHSDFCWNHIPDQATCPVQDLLDAVNRHEWRQLLFVITFLHSTVQERRKFGPIGWNVPYEFNQSDLSACIQFLQVLMHSLLPFLYFFTPKSPFLASLFCYPLYPRPHPQGGALLCKVA
jgi:hypothetical protein